MNDSRDLTPGKYILQTGFGEGNIKEARSPLYDLARRNFERAIKAQDEVLRGAFQSTFGKKFNPETVYKPNLRRYTQGTFGDTRTIHWAYCNRVFLVQKDVFDIKDGRCYVSYTIPKKMFVRRDKNTIKYVGE